MNPAFDPKQPHLPASDLSETLSQQPNETSHQHPSGAGFTSRPTLAQLVFLANQASAQVSLRTLEVAARLI